MFALGLWLRGHQHSDPVVTTEPSESGYISLSPSGLGGCRPHRRPRLRRARSAEHPTATQCPYPRTIRASHYAVMPTRHAVALPRGGTPWRAMVSASASICSILLSPQWGLRGPYRRTNPTLPYTVIARRGVLARNVRIPTANMVECVRKLSGVADAKDLRRSLPGRLVSTNPHWRH